VTVVICGGRVKENEKNPIRSIHKRAQVRGENRWRKKKKKLGVGENPPNFAYQVALDSVSVVETEKKRGVKVHTSDPPFLD